MNYKKVYIFVFKKFRSNDFIQLINNFIGGNFMKEEPIILEWIEDGEKNRKEINRQEFLYLMEGIKNAFFDDNQISSMLVELIPNLITISINKDRNEQKDVPSIYCVCEKEERQIDIIRYHKIIWSILNHYCA